MNDFLDLPPIAQCQGRVVLPGSKSISNRVLLLAALAHGTTPIENLLESEDTDVMQAALKALGVSIHKRDGIFYVRGAKGKIQNQQGEFFLCNAGTAFRFLTAVLAISSGNYVLSGIERMNERPIGDLTDALKQIGAQIEMENEGFPPLKIAPFADNGERKILLKGDISSQFLSALLMALPLTGKAFEIKIDGVLISKPYVAMTIALMQQFGVAVVEQNGVFLTPENAKYQSPGNFRVESDASSASYFWALGALLSKDGVQTEGIPEHSIQGDVAFLKVLREMGAVVFWRNQRWGVRRGANGLKAITVDANDFPDAAMTLATLAAFADGTTTIKNIASWRVKETDRLSAMATELKKLGVGVKTTADSIVITPPEHFNFKPASIATYNDHRMAMSFSLFSAAIPLRIENPECVGKTFPNYFAALHNLVDAVPVIAIDGPSASGKGTIAQKVAQQLGFHYLDSGALYRLVAFAAFEKNLALTVENERTLAEIARNLPVGFKNGEIFFNEKIVSDAIRTEEVGNAASFVAAMPLVRRALLFLQRAQRLSPGLVGDGRDMGSVIFPDAPLKIYLDASAEVRAERRYKQLKEKGFSVNLAALTDEMRARDARDLNRPNAPLLKAADAVLIPTDDLTIDSVVAAVLKAYQNL